MAGNSVLVHPGPKPVLIPSVRATVFTTVTFVVWVGGMAGLSAMPQHGPPRTIYAFSYVLLGVAVVVCVYDHRGFAARCLVRLGLRRRVNEPRQYQYSSARANTILTTTLTMFVVPLLYCLHWYPDRIRTKLVFEEDTVNSAYFPPFTLFQEADWTSQANLGTSASPKCFLGSFNEQAPDCNLVEPGTLPCRCDGFWGESIEDFVWGNTRYRSLSFNSTAALRSLVPDIQMIAQAFYYYNTSQARADSSRVLSPSLSIAIYDPDLTLEYALKAGYTRMVLLDASGMVEINLGLRSRQAIGQSPALDYRLTMSPIPAESLPCDLGNSEKPPDGPCFISLRLKFPTFDRESSTRQPALSFIECASYVAAWLGGFQLVGWIVSGSAFGL